MKLLSFIESGLQQILPDRTDFSARGSIKSALPIFKFLRLTLSALFIILAMASAVPPGLAATDGKVSGTFIQLNRANASWPVERWKNLFKNMQNIKIDTVIIQWSAEEPVLYFKDKDLPFNEQYDALERLMEAAQGFDLSIFLGLQNDPAYWNEITGRDKVLRDYFLVRRAKNEHLQASLLNKFGNRANWAGYYIPDEIDDLSWRENKRRDILKNYLKQTIESIRNKDTKRPIAISAFFRTRTAPSVFTNMLFNLTDNIGLDYLLLQDGAGNNDPPLDVTPMYYRALSAKGQERAPEIWIVLEAFRQTSGQIKEFSAEPARADDFLRQIQVTDGFKRRILFAFPDYVDPDLGPAAQALYKILGGHYCPPEKQE